MLRHHAYRCEVIARNLTGTREVILAAYRAITPRLAARWARTTARRYAELLAPAPTAPYLDRAPLIEAGPGSPRPDVALHRWADSPEQYEAALRTLAEGRAYVIAVDDYDAWYELRVDPVPVHRPFPPPAPIRCARASAGVGRHRRPHRGRHTVP